MDYETIHLYPFSLLAWLLSVCYSMSTWVVETSWDSVIELVEIRSFRHRRLVLGGPTLFSTTLVNLTCLIWS